MWPQMSPQISATFVRLLRSAVCTDLFVTLCEYTSFMRVFSGKQPNSMIGPSLWRTL